MCLDSKLFHVNEYSRLLKDVSVQLTALYNSSEPTAAIMRNCLQRCETLNRCFLSKSASRYFMILFLLYLFLFLLLFLTCHCAKITLCNRFTWHECLLPFAVSRASCRPRFLLGFSTQWLLVAVMSNTNHPSSAAQITLESSRKRSDSLKGNRKNKVRS